jgi:isoquinoline 1-oxidoreductase alpha subunit
MQVTINSRPHTLPDAPARLLLWVLRDELGLMGTRYGCGIGQCGACTVHVDGEAVRSCITPLAAVAGKSIRTIEGLAEGEPLHPVLQAFLDLQVPQCAWCMTGQVMTAAALLEAAPEAAEEEILDTMDRCLCRCGTYGRIRRAVLEAQRRIQAGAGA